MVNDNLLTLQIVGTDDDQGNVRFDDFIKQLDAFRHALSETDRIVTSGHTVYYRVVDLKHSSPAAVVLEAVGERAGEVLGTFSRALRDLQEHKLAPESFDYSALMAYKGITGQLGREVAGVTVSNNGSSLAVSEALARNIEVILGPDVYEVGDFTGMLHQISLHGGQKSFTVYPTWGGSKHKMHFSSRAS